MRTRQPDDGNVRCMTLLDRRAWLSSVTLALGGAGVARLREQPSQAPIAPAAGGGKATPVVRLSLNENPYGPAPAVVGAIQKEFSNLCRYTGLELDDLVRAIAASFNAGIGGAAEGHAIGNVDAYTTNGYAARALQNYQNLLRGVTP